MEIKIEFCKTEQKIKILQHCCRAAERGIACAEWETNHDILDEQNGEQSELSQRRRQKATAHVQVQDSLRQVSV
jgi:hypothetical protein